MNRVCPDKHASKYTHDGHAYMLSGFLEIRFMYACAATVPDCAVMDDFICLDRLIVLIV